MQYPIVLTGDNRSIYACEWNGDIHEIHTLESLQKEYGTTNLFDDEPSWYSTAAEQNLTFLEVLEELLTEYEQAKQIAKAKKKGVVFTLNGNEKEFYTLRTLDMEKAIAYLDKHHPNQYALL